MQASEWRRLMRALAEEIDAIAGPAESAKLLRLVGKRLAASQPLQQMDSIDGLQAEINDALAILGLGTVRLELNEAQRALVLSHLDLPGLGPLGSWLAPVLEGLYETWLLAQPGSDPSLAARREAAPGEAIRIRFARS